MRTLVGSDDFSRRLGVCIKIVSTPAGLTLRELAEKIGILPSTMYEYVRGLIEVPDSVLQDIQHLTGTDPRQLL